MSTIKSSAENLTLNADGANNDVIIQSNASTKVTVDGATGNVGIGVASAYNPASGRKALTIEGTSNASIEMAVNGARKGYIYHDATNFHFSTEVSGGNVILAPHATGDVKITNSDIIFDTAGKGIVLGATTNVDANTLDDYEEGTWTPTLTCSSSGSYTLDTGANLAAYTKIGRVVHVQASIGIASESSPNGNLRMSLPFTSFTGTKDTDNSMGNATLEGHGGTIVNGIHIFVFGAAYAQFPFIADNGTFDYLDHSHVDTAFSIKFSFSYIAV